MATENKRSLKDLNLSVSKACPAAGASNNSDSLDLGTTSPGRVPRVELLLELPATPNLADTKTITLTLKDSADNSSFAAVADVPAQVTTGSGVNGGTAIAYQFKLPITHRRYVRVDATIVAAAGDSTAKSYSLSVLA